MQFTNTFLNRLLVASVALTFAVMTGLANAKSAEQDELVGNAETTFDNFENDPQMPWLQHHIGEAKAVLIAPKIVKAGFILGGSGGRAVLIARDPKTGKWLGPAFYTLATASVGFQAGVQVSESVTLVMTDKALNALLSNSFKIGGDASVATGPVGAGAQQDVTADMVAFSRSKGLYGGVNLDGTVVTSNNEWNEKYYGKKDVLPPDILIRSSVTSSKGRKLGMEVAAASAASAKIHDE